MTTETELKSDVRSMTGLENTMVLSEDGLDTAYRRAKRHIRLNSSLSENIDWFGTDNPAAEEALFWYTCLFSKVAVGELDSNEFQAGAIDEKALLAKADDDVTTWYRNADSALKSLNSGSIIQSSAPSRSGRSYETPSFGVGDNRNSGSSTSTDL